MGRCPRQWIPPSWRSAAVGGIAVSPTTSTVRPMSAIPCPVCGKLRKVEQVSAPEGWVNPQCWNCGDPGWVQPYDEDDPLAGRGTRAAAPLDRP